MGRESAYLIQGLAGTRQENSTGGRPKPTSLLNRLSKCLIKPKFAYFTESGTFKTLATLPASFFFAYKKLKRENMFLAYGTDTALVPSARFSA